MIPDCRHHVDVKGGLKGTEYSVWEQSLNSCMLHLLEEVLDGREGAGVLLIGAVGGVHSGAGLVIHLVTLPGGRRGEKDGE